MSEPAVTFADARALLIRPSKMQARTPEFKNPLLEMPISIN